MGILGIDILPPSQSAAAAHLAVSAIKERPVVRKADRVARTMMVTVSCEPSGIDGVVAGRFLQEKSSASSKSASPGLSTRISRDSFAPARLDH